MNDQVIAITGAFGVLGFAAAQAALAGGAKVAAIDFAASPPAPLDAHLKLASVDLTDEGAANKAIAAVVEKFGRLDALLNIAGGFVWQTVQDGPNTTWDRLFALNLKTALNASKAALPFLAQSGRGAIVNVGAFGAQRAAAGMGAYAASKAGVHRLTESLAEEWKGRVRVNAVLPTIIDTPANRADMPSADFSTWVRPEELVAVMLFLASPQASAVTSALTPVVGRV